MAGKGLRVLLVTLMSAVVLIGMVSGTQQTSSTVPEYETDHWWSVFFPHKSFKECFANCTDAICHYRLPWPPASAIPPAPAICAVTPPICFPKCLVFRQAELSDVHNYCNSGCVSSKCANISPWTNHGGEELLKNCVKDCYNGCGKNYC